MKAIVGLIVLIASSSVLASGWNCKEANNGYPRAKLYNSTTNPRVPAKLVVSHRSGTFFTADEEMISKKNLSNGVRYTASEEGIQVVLFVQYREGAEAPLEEGEEVYGKLIVVNEDSRKTYDMDCARYLKN